MCMSRAPIVRIGIIRDELALPGHAAVKGFKAPAAAGIALLTITQSFLASGEAAFALHDFDFAFSQRGARGSEFGGGVGDVLIMFDTGAGEVGLGLFSRGLGVLELLDV